MIGYKIVLFTNQAGLSTLGKFKISDFKGKIVQKIGVPIQVWYNHNYNFHINYNILINYNIFTYASYFVGFFIAVRKSIYRKPTIGMWEFLEKEVHKIFLNI